MADNQSPLAPGPLSWRLIQLTDDWKLKPGDVNPSAGCLTTNHLLANPVLDLVTPLQSPPGFITTALGREETKRLLRSSVSALSLAGYYPSLLSPGDVTMGELRG